MSMYEPGVLRQIWLSDDGGTTKHPFLVRDDAYSLSDAGQSRSVRLGQPVDLGPNGAWRQVTWSGGEDQQLWDDPAMYDKGNLDVTDRAGLLRLWPGWDRLAYSGNMTNHPAIGIMLPSASGSGENTSLLFGESWNVTGGANPTSYRLLKADWSTESVSTVQTFDYPVYSMARWDHDAASHNSDPVVGILLFDGSFYSYDASDGSLTDWSGTKRAPAGQKCMVGFNDSMYLCRGNRFERLAMTDSSFSWTTVKTLDNIQRFHGMVVWNNRIWFAGRARGGVTRVFTSDGNVVVEAFTVPGEFVVTDMVAHYGSLYLVGDKYVAPGGQDVVGQVWRYNGASVSLVFEQGKGKWGQNNNGNIRMATSWGRFLVWTRDGDYSEGTKPGVMLYDAEEDAVMEGPCLDLPSAHDVRVTAVQTWTDTLAVSMSHMNGTTYTFEVMFLRRDGRVSNVLTGTEWTGLNSSAISRYILSSRFDADLPAENKVWLRGTMRCKVPQGTQIVVKALFDDDDTEHTIHTVTYDSGATSWRQVEFPLTSSAGYHRSMSVRYKLYLENTAPNTYTTATPEVSDFFISFQPSPTKRRRWSLRTVNQDEQYQLDGTTANPLDTRVELADKLESFWASGTPITFWGPFTDATEPTGDGVEVMMSDYMEQSWRLVSDDDEVVSESSFFLTEV